MPPALKIIQTYHRPYTIDLYLLHLLQRRLFFLNHPFLTIISILIYFLPVSVTHISPIFLLLLQAVRLKRNLLAFQFLAFKRQIVVTNAAKGRYLFITYKQSFHSCVCFWMQFGITESVPTCSKMIQVLLHLSF